jgi:hypothetical protein
VDLLAQDRVRRAPDAQAHLCSSFEIDVRLSTQYLDF